jgi:hypothetical protein
MGKLYVKLTKERFYCAFMIQINQKLKNLNYIPIVYVSYEFIVFNYVSVFYCSKTQVYILIYYIITLSILSVHLLRLYEKNESSS